MKAKCNSDILFELEYCFLDIVAAWVFIIVLTMIWTDN